jgi:hypothetical protein
MVSIYKRNLSDGTKKYRAQGFVGRERISKTFKSYEEARKWGEELENNPSMFKIEPQEKNNYNQPINLSERNQIQKFLAQNYTISTISRIIGRSKNGILVEVRRNGGRKCYNATLAHERATNIKKTKYENISKINATRGINPWKNIKKRIEILEMQLEIVIDYIQNQKKENKK